MWNIQVDGDKEIFERLQKHAKISGIIFVILGLIGIFFPVFMTMATVVFVSWLMLFAGISSGYFTYMSNRTDWWGWVKAAILIAISLYMLFVPMGGVATLGMLLAIYFFTDAFAGFGLSASLYPQKGWWIWSLNALLSLAIGLFFLSNWPFSSLYLVGLLVGFSLFFDGLALLMGVSFVKKMKDAESQDQE
jgi:uncharacterized membrane protein HdeD (DUF308 family)